MAEKADGVWYHPPEQASGKGWGWILWPFGLIAPLIGAALGFILLLAALWALTFINVAVQSQLISLMINAVSANIWVFFLFFLVMGYLDYLTKSLSMGFLVLKPVSNAIAITFAAWVLAWVLRTVGAFSGAAPLVYAGTLARLNLTWIFFIFLILGYISLSIARKR